jgi:dTMP kinase
MILAFEGLDGAGKSTAALQLSAELTKKRIDNVLVSSASLSEDESDEIEDDDEDADFVFRKIWRLRDELEQRFGPRSLCLSNAWEFAYRWESQVVPALEAGKVVIADRYIDTPLVREVLRGIDEAYVRSVYSFAPAPDLVLYLDLDPETAYQRKTQARLLIGYFEAGRDVIRTAKTVRMSFVAFQNRCRDRYRDLLAREDVVQIDAARPAVEVHAAIVQAVLPRLDVPAKKTRRRR